MAREPGKRDSCQEEAARIVAITGLLGFAFVRLTLMARRRWLRLCGEYIGTPRTGGGSMTESRQWDW